MEALCGAYEGGKRKSQEAGKLEGWKAELRHLLAS